MTETPEILARARRIEQNQMECSNNFLFSQTRSPDYLRWQELSSGAYPAAWAIEKAFAETQDA